MKIHLKTLSAILSRGRWVKKLCVVLQVIPVHLWRPVRRPQWTPWLLGRPGAPPTRTPCPHPAPPPPPPLMHTSLCPHPWCWRLRETRAAQMEPTLGWIHLSCMMTAVRVVWRGWVELNDPWDIWMKFQISNFQANVCDLWLKLSLAKWPSFDCYWTLLISQHCWCRSLLPYCVTRPQWMKGSIGNRVCWPFFLY